jgi:hypothetical protein
MPARPRGPRSTPRRARLFDQGEPVVGMNQLVVDWLAERAGVVEHTTPAAFSLMRTAYDLEVDILRSPEGGEHSLWQAHRIVLCRLTDLMLGQDVTGLLSSRLSAENLNPGGFRSALAQGAAKNSGENFVNVVVYALAQCLAHQDEVLVDKGLPPPVRPMLSLSKSFNGTRPGTARDIEIKIESDLAIWQRGDPGNAIIVSAKTRLKEIFHIAVMWKMLFDSIGDPHLMAKWNLTGPSSSSDMTMVFVTADMVPPGAARTQGGDVERGEVRNLIAMDASFMDYVFVSKTGIGHVSPTLDYSAGRETLFHELGALFDLIQQKFGIEEPPA